MRTKLKVEEAEKVCLEAETAAKSLVKRTWNEQWNIAALEHLQYLDDMTHPVAKEHVEKMTNLKIVEGGPTPEPENTASEKPEGDEKEYVFKQASGAQIELDRKFGSMMDDFLKVVLDTLGESVASILNLSKHYLAEEAQSALQDFYKLYFCAVGSQQMSDSTLVNDEVERIMREAMEEVPNDDIKEDIEEKEKRLALSSVQKRLATIISLDEDLKEKLLPVLTSMQFEELTCHRTRNLLDLLRNLAQESANPSLTREERHKDLIKKVTSTEELRQYVEQFVDEDIEFKNIDGQQSIDKVLLF